MAPCAVVRFGKRQCGPCPAKAEYTTGEARTINFLPRRIHELQERNHDDQQDSACRKLYALRSGTEGAITESVAATAPCPRCTQSLYATWRGEGWPAVSISTCESRRGSTPAEGGTVNVRSVSRHPVDEAAAEEQLKILEPHLKKLPMLIERSPQGGGLLLAMSRSLEELGFRTIGDPRAVWLGTWEATVHAMQAGAALFLAAKGADDAQGDRLGVDSGLG